MTAPTIDADTVDRVRQALAEATTEGRPRPGRPTLAKLTGATEHQVRQALVVLDMSGSPAGGELAPTVNQPTPTVNQPVTSPPDLAAEDGVLAAPITSLVTEIHQPGELSSPGSPAPASGSPVDQLPGPLVVEIHQPGEPLAPAGGAPGELVTPASPAATSPPVSVRHARPWPLIVIGLAAAVAVWGGWVELGRFTGFGVVQPLPGIWDDLRINTAVVLPLGIEAYGGYALRTWLSSAALTARTRSFARWSAIASLVVGAGAQVASHLMRAANVVTAPPLVTVLVACVPVLVLGLATGLATLVKRDSSAGEEA